MNKTKNGITELVFILDKSGSMSGLEADTIGGFNSMIAKQKKEDGKVYVSTVLFSDKSTVLYDRVDIGGIPAMTDKDYVPCGSTALLDAIGDSVKHIRNIHKYDCAVEYNVSVFSDLLLYYKFLCHIENT